MKQYLDLLEKVLKEGIDRSDRTGIGNRSLFGSQMRFKMDDGFPIVTTKKVPFKSVLSELLWFIEGSSDERRLAEILYGKPREEIKDKTTIWFGNANSDYWSPKAKFEGDLGKIYGVQWRRQSFFPKEGSFGESKIVDQLKSCIESIKKDPYGRRHIVSCWNTNDLEDMALPPCHVMFQFYVAENKLSLQMYQRSADSFLGVPFNIASYSLLLHMVAQVCGLIPNEFIHTLGDTHIYSNHFEAVKEQLTRTPKKLPKLWINPDKKDIDSFNMGDFKLLEYDPYPAIKAEMAV